MWKFLKRIFLDLLLTYIPTGRRLEGFAFIVHPRDYNDVVNNVPFLKHFPKWVVYKVFPHVWPFTVSSIRGLESQSGRSLPGWVIGVPIFARELTENRSRARRQIAKAIRLAKHKGAKVVGLGGLTGSVMEGGAGMSKQNGVIVTAGRAYTAYTVLSYVEDAMKTFGLAHEDTAIAVVGAAGGVGSAITRLLVKQPFKKIILIDLERKTERIKGVVQEASKHDIEITHQVGAVKQADIIITVTNAPEAVVESDDIKPGAIIIDDAQPSDISPDIIESRDDIVVIEAGVIYAGQDLRVGTDFRLANRDEVYCCLGEVMCIAASDMDADYKPDQITEEIVSRFGEIGKELGFRLAPYQAYGKLVGQGQIENVRKIVSRVKKYA